MKKFFNLLIKNPILIVLAFIVVFILPSALFLNPDADIRGNVAIFGLDYKNGNFEVSALTFIPTPNSNYTEKYKIISAEGVTVGDAIGKINTYSGKRLGFIHMDLVVIGKEMAEENVFLCLDYLVRTADLNNNTNIVFTNKTAMDFLKIASKIMEESSIHVSETITNNKEFLNGANTNLAYIYKSLYAPTNSCLLEYVEIAPEDKGLTTEKSSGGSPSGSDSSGGGESGGGEEKGDALIISEKMGLAKNGRVIDYLNLDEHRGFNWVSKNVKKGEVTIENYSDEYISNATVTYSFLDKKVMSKAYYINGTPVINYYIQLSLTLDEVKTFNHTKQKFESSIKPLSIKGETDIADKIKKDFSKFLGKTINNKADILGVYQMLENYNKEKFDMFLDSLDNEENYLDKIQFRISCDIRIKN